MLGRSGLTRAFSIHYGFIKKKKTFVIFFPLLLSAPLAIPECGALLEDFPAILLRATVLLLAPDAGGKWRSKTCFAQTGMGMDWTAKWEDLGLLGESREGEEADFWLGGGRNSSAGKGGKRICSCS